MSAMSLAYHMDVAAEQRSLSAASVQEAQRIMITRNGSRPSQSGRPAGPVHGIGPGDVVWIPPGVKHWHGASPATAMTHIVIQEHEGGKVVDWLVKVSDEQYGNPPPSPR